MAGKSTSARETLDVKAHILIIESRYYEQVAHALLEGALAELAASGATYDKINVPGALEIPQALAQAIASGLLPADASGARYDGAIVLGCVIRGETSHYDIVVNNANHWLMELAIRNNVPVGNAILTVDTEAQAMARARGVRKGKGADAVRACLSLVQISRVFEEIEE
ncbi:MAG: 6,7-dimethyl-8-ribityllumazine synthase [Hyphomicrobiaceae bacterium]|nr:6,7-dimethyl-8-ribityllumazine synthase [Hyphomicrobiaceae bacterium]